MVRQEAAPNAQQVQRRREEECGRQDSSTQFSGGCYESKRAGCDDARRTIACSNSDFPSLASNGWPRDSPRRTTPRSKQIAPTARLRGYLTRSEFLRLCEWKTPRTRSRCASNSRGRSRNGRASRSQKQIRPSSAAHLTQLDGVALPTASVILHFCSRDPYPILDVRALWSLGVETRPRDTARSGRTT